MKTGTRVAMVVVSLVLLHFLLHVGFGIASAAPDLLTLSLLIAAREVRMGTAAGLGFALGLMEDSFSALAFGGSTIALTLVGAAGARTRDLFVGDSLLFGVSYLLFGKWVRDLVQWLVVGEGVRQPFFDAIMIQAPIAAAYVAIVGVFTIASTGSRLEIVR